MVLSLKEEETTVMVVVEANSGELSCLIKKGFKCKNPHVIVMKVQKYTYTIFSSKTTHEILKVAQK